MIPVDMVVKYMHITKNIYFNLKDKRNFKLYVLDNHTNKTLYNILIWYNYRTDIAILVSSKRYGNTSHGMYSTRNRTVPYS